jgi:multidrug efflux system membrane fusion protein
MKIRSLITALAIIIFTALWVGSGYFTKPSQTSEAPADVVDEVQEDFTVRYIESKSSDFNDTFKIIGKTEPNNLLELRFETNGTIKKIHTEKGEYINSGSVICELEPDDRIETFDSAKAKLDDAQVKFDSREELVKAGYNSKNSLISEKSNLEQARASFKRAQIEVERIETVAPINGTIDDIIPEVGELATIGNICAILVNTDIIIVSGNVSEKNVSKLTKGMPAKVRLIDGSIVDGVLTYISNVADPNTRTFSTEVTVDNSKNTIKVGTTTEVYINNNILNAHLIPSSILSLSDNGNIGIKIIDDNNKVKFIEVEVTNLNNKGAYISNLPETIRVITVGQDYVKPGDTVNAVIDNINYYE